MDEFLCLYLGNLTSLAWSITYQISWLTSESLTLDLKRVTKEVVTVMVAAERVPVRLEGLDQSSHLEPHFNSVPLTGQVHIDIRFESDSPC